MGFRCAIRNRVRLVRSQPYGCDMKIYLRYALLAAIAVPFLSGVPAAGPQTNDLGGPAANRVVGGSEAEMLASAAIAGEFHNVALTVPEPGTLVIFATGLFGLGLMRARRRSA